MNELNALREAEIGDPEIAARISAYELAFRLQASAPDLIDLDAGEHEPTQAGQRRLDVVEVPVG